jgi:hypothetical protein
MPTTAPGLRPEDRNLSEAQEAARRELAERKKREKEEAGTRIPGHEEARPDFRFIVV